MKRNAWFVVFVTANAIACGERGSQSSVVPSDAAESSSPSVSASEAAGARVDALRARFRLGARPAISAAAATGFEAVDASHFRAPFEREVVRTSIPSRANAPVELQDTRSGVLVRFALRGAADVAAAKANGLVLYRNVLPGADVVYRVDERGIEDFVAFEQRPLVEELVYDVDVSRVASLRIAERGLEFVDARGTARLRVSPPWVVDARGYRREATLRIEGCQYDDTSLGPPSNRPLRSCVVHVAWSGATYPALVDPSWTAGNGTYQYRGGATLTVLPDGRAIANGGFVEPEIYDPATGNFSFFGTGCAGSVTAEARHTATLLGSGKVLLAGGILDAIGPQITATSSLEDGKDSTLCETTGAMRTPRANHTATRLPSGKVLLTGGQTTTDTASALSSAEVYDAVTGTFALVGALSVPRTNHSATLLATGKVLVANGTSGTSAELFDPATSTFSPTGASIVARLGKPTATLLGNGKVLVAGGRSNATTRLDSAELYDPATATFSATGSMLTARDQHMAVLLPNGKVLVIGGDTNRAELYDPKKGTFSATVAPIAAYPRGALALLQNGKVLVMPEQGVSEVYDPAKPLGAVCSTAADCDSDICTDGVCCDMPCAGQCQACNAVGKVGECTTITGEPHAPRKACAGAGGLCGGSCRGTNPNACAFADSKTVCASTCSNNSQTTFGCNGLGDCVAGAAVSCNNLSCADPTVCRTSCASSADCLAGFSCEAGKCINGTTCIDDDTAQPLTGPPQECAPYKCALGCKTGCVSVNDCVAPNVCSSSGKCIAPVGAPSEEGCSTSGSTYSGTVWPVLVLLGLGARRKRRGGRAGSTR